MTRCVPSPSRYGKCCGQKKPGSGWLLYSDNLFNVTDPAQATWELLPRGDRGIRAPEAGRAEEHFVVRVGSTTSSSSSQQRMLVVFRTDHGKLGAASVTALSIADCLS